MAFPGFSLLNFYMESALFFETACGKMPFLETKCKIFFKSPIICQFLGNLLGIFAFFFVYFTWFFSFLGNFLKFFQLLLNFRSQTFETFPSKSSHDFCVLGLPTGMWASLNWAVGNGVAEQRGGAYLLLSSFFGIRTTLFGQYQYWKGKRSLICPIPICFLEVSSKFPIV